MVIFAIMAITLFAVIGLSVDAGFSYLASDAAERAAAGAALAGVPYLPDDFPDAQKAAWEEAARNGFRDGDVARNVHVLVSQPPGTTHQLTVEVDVDVPTTFLRLLGFGTHTVRRSATAEYLRPVQLGQPGSQIGSPICTSGAPSNCLGSGGNQYYFVRTEGWGNPRHEGDAFTPSNQADPNSVCGPPPGNNPCTPSPPDYHLLSAVMGTESRDTSTPQILSDRGGYNYLIHVPANTNVDLQVYNPLFAPDKPLSGVLDYHEYDGSFRPGSQTATDYSAMAYTVFRVANLFDHQNESVVSQIVFYPIDATGKNPSCQTYCRFDPTNGSPIGVSGSLPPTYHNWIDVTHYNPSSQAEKNLVQQSPSPKLLSTNQHLSGGSSGAYYRLRVSNLDFAGHAPDANGNNGSGNGSSNKASFAHKGYAVRLVDSSTGNPCGTTGCTGASISGLDDLCIYTPINNNTNSQASFDIPIFQIDKEYANKQIDVNIFDPGDVSGNAYLKVMQPPYVGSTGVNHPKPAIATVRYVEDLGPHLPQPIPSTETGRPISPYDGVPSHAYIQTAQSSNVFFNGNWVHFRVVVPSDWSPTPGQYWSLEYTVDPNTVASDTVTIQVTYAGTPVHLLP